MVRRFLMLCGACAALMAAVVSASATTYYVAPAPDGNDTNAGTQAAPFATIQKAADVVVAGDTVVVTAGTYAGAKLTKSGTTGAPIVFSAASGAIVATAGSQNTNGDGLWISNASYVTVSGFEVKNVARAGISVDAGPGEAESHGVVVSGNSVHDNGQFGIATSYAEGVRIDGNVVAGSVAQHGIYVAFSSDNPVIVGNTVHDNFLSGIQVDAVPSTDGDDDIIVNAVVDSNTIYGNGTGGGAAILFAAVRNGLVIDNLAYDNHALGIYLWNAGDAITLGSTRNRIFNNTIFQAVDGGPACTLDNGSIENSVNNNILLGAGFAGSIDCDGSSESELVSDYNVIVGPITFAGDPITVDEWVARGHDAHSFGAIATDLFVSVAASNFDLKPTSPAIDTGRPVTQVPDDIRGVVRPQGPAYDIGAYEYFVDTGTPNHDPIVSAGPDQTVDPGDVVELTGAGSTDPDGDPLTFTWIQTAGPTVALAGAMTVTPSFTAPDVTADTILTFQLTVTDGHGGFGVDTVSVTVTAPPPAKKIFVTKPAQGASWKAGTKKKVRFVAESGVVGDVRIELSHDGGQTFATVLASVSVDRRKAKITVTGPPTTQAVVRVTLNSDPRVFGVSPVFTIR